MRKINRWQNNMCRDMAMCMQKTACCDVDSHGRLLGRMCKPSGPDRKPV